MHGETEHTCIYLALHLHRVSFKSAFFAGVATKPCEPVDDLVSVSTSYSRSAVLMQKGLVFNAILVREIGASAVWRGEYDQCW